VLHEPALPWLAAGLVLMVLEAVAPGAFLVWLGLAGMGTGLMVFVFAFGFSTQVASFAVLAALCIGLGLALRRKRRVTGVNAPGSGLVGRTALALAFQGREGRVRLGDSDWPARLADGMTAPEAGIRLMVIGVDGMVLIVRPAEMTEA
jgi:membrane protein implicated in regulation of membrane protease activity